MTKDLFLSFFRAAIRPVLTTFAGRFILAFAAIYLIINVATLSDYGVMSDSWELLTGDRGLYFYGTLNADYLDFGKEMPISEYDRPDHPDFDAEARESRLCPAIVQPHHIWPVGPVLSSLTKKIFYSWLGLLGPIEAHHLAPVLLFLALIVTVYIWVWLVAGRWPAVFTVLALTTYPRMLAHSHFNLKDMPSAAIFVAVIVVFYFGIMREKWWLIAISAALWGLGVATKGNALFMPFILIPWFLWALWLRRKEGASWFRRSMWIALACYPIIGLAVAALAWPYLLMDFPVHLKHHITYITSRGYSGETGWQLGPLRNAVITAPLVVLMLALVGVATLIRRRREPIVQTAGPLIGLWLLVPVIRVSVPGALDFDVIRHWLEFVPALCVLAGFGGGELFQLGAVFAKRRWPQLKDWQPGRKAALGLLGAAVLFLPVLTWDIKNHPYQLVYYNALTGGLVGAQGRGYKASTDYWGISTRTGIRWINANAGRNAILLAPVNSSAVSFTRKAWLRGDIQFIPVETFSAEQTLETIIPHKGELYIMYPTRTELYDDYTMQMDKTSTPYKTIEVDGAVIFKILKFTKDAGSPNLRPVTPP